MILVYKKPGEMPEKIVSAGTLKSLQTLVGGFIEVAWFDTTYFKGDGRLTVYCNEDGLMLGLPFNIARPTDRHPIVGPIVMVKENDEGETVEMTEAEVDFVLKHFTRWAEVCEQMERQAN